MMVTKIILNFSVKGKGEEKGFVVKLMPDLSSAPSAWNIILLFFRFLSLVT